MDPDSLRHTLKIFKAASSGLEKKEKYIMTVILDVVVVVYPVTIL